MKEKITIAANSSMLYVTAFLITTMFHELAHAVLGVLNNSAPILHHNYVEHLTKSELSTPQLVAIALAGPVFSLIQGILAGWVYLKSTQKGLMQLFLLWMSILGFNNFLGYLMTGPLFNSGDIGKAYEILGTPFIVQILIALIGAALLVFIAYKLTRPFLKFSYKQEWVADKKARKNFSFHVIILPWIIGSLIITFLYLPIIAIVSIIYPITSGMIFIFPWQNADSIQNVSLSTKQNTGKFSVPIICVLIILIIGFKFVLAPGIRF